MEAATNEKSWFRHSLLQPASCPLPGVHHSLKNGRSPNTLRAINTRTAVTFGWHERLVVCHPLGAKAAISRSCGVPALVYTVRVVSTLFGCFFVAVKLELMLTSV